MSKKYPIVLMLIFLSIISSVGDATAARAPKEVATDVANFNYTPDSQRAPGSAGVTFAVGKVVYKDQPDRKITWFKFPQLLNLPDAIRHDLSETLTAGGFSVRGPFDSYDLIPYQDKKAIDLYLTPTIELSVITPEETYSIEDIKIEVAGRIILELREIVTRELMWVKSIPLTKFDFSFVPGGSTVERTGRYP